MAPRGLSGTSSQGSARLFMFSFIAGIEKIGGNGAKAYQCASCGGLITHSDQLLAVEGKNRHFHVNPAGVECDFHTFLSCPGAIAAGEATEDHTWFPGYGWRMAFCKTCGQHLGWHYEALSTIRHPRRFWGILVPNVRAVYETTPTK